MPPEQVSRETSVLKTVFEIIVFTLIAFAIVIPFRFFIAQPFIVSGSSMVPTIHPRDYLVIDLLSQNYRALERGDVIVFRYPFDPSVYFVKRVVGLPEETVTIRDGAVYVTSADGADVLLVEPYIAEENKTQDSSTTVLAAGEYFVMGDNRSGSSDSRVWGPLQEKFILGRAILRLYPFADLDYLPGAHEF